MENKKKAKASEEAKTLLTDEQVGDVNGGAMISVRIEDRTVHTVLVTKSDAALKAEADAGVMIAESARTIPANKAVEYKPAVD